MDVRIKELVEYVKRTFDLDDYFLQRHSIDRQLSKFNETSYLLSMEWFPNHEADRTEEELNPDGAAIIELDLHSKKLEHVIFVGNISYAQGITFSADALKEVIKWVEQETNLVHGRDFQTDEVDDHEFRFIASHKGIPVYPRASIEVKIDDSGKLTHFAKVGHFPDEETFEEEEYTLSFEKIEDTVKEQVTLVEWPDYEKEQMNIMYGIEEMFIKNDQTSTFACDVVEFPTSYITVDRRMNTSPAIDKKFDEKEIEWIEDIPVEEAFANEPSPDAQTISEEEVEECEKSVETFLRQMYPGDQNEWVLTVLYRERGYMHAVLKINEQNKRPLQRKIVVFIDSESLEVLNYMDNNLMIKAMDTFTEAASVQSTKDDAFIKLKSHIELTPYYVFDHQKYAYVLCGKLDCHYAVDAHTVELMDIEDL